METVEKRELLSAVVECVVDDETLMEKKKKKTYGFDFDFDSNSHY